MNPNVFFHEEQQFDSPWLRLTSGIICFILIVPFGYGIFQQLILKRPLGNHPLSNTGLLLAGLSVLLTCGGLVVLLIGAKLTTEVREDGVFYRFFPFQRAFHRIALQDLQSWDAVTYRPLPDYGGWGIRYGLRGKAFNVRGNKGVQLVLKNGDRILFGSQRAEEMERSLDAALHRTR